MGNIPGLRGKCNLQTASVWLLPYEVRFILQRSTSGGNGLGMRLHCKCVHAVYAIGCDPGSCSFPRDCVCKLTLATTPNNVRPTFQASWSTHGIHCSWSTLICMVAPVLSQVSLCTAGLGLVVVSDSLGTVLQWDLCTHTTQELWALWHQLHSSRPCRWAYTKGCWRTCRHMTLNRAQNFPRGLEMIFASLKPILKHV